MSTGKLDGIRPRREAYSTSAQANNQTVRLAGPPNPENRQNINEHRILRLIHSFGISTRNEIIRQTGLSAPTVSKVLASLLDAGFLEEVESEDLQVGRPPKKLRLARNCSQVLGIVIAPGTSWVVSTGLDGELVPERMFKIRTPDTYETLIDSLVEQARLLMSRPEIETLGAGICVPGLVDLTTNVSVLSTNARMIEGRSPTQDLMARLGIECVTIQAKHSLCLAEAHFGEADLNDFALLDLSTGAALGVVSRGYLLEGKNGFAGELGHITVDPRGALCVCGNQGCLATVASDVSVASRVSKRLGRYVDIDQVVALTRASEIDMKEEIDNIIFYLSVGLASVINIFNPPTLILHGRLFDLSDDLFSQVLDETRSRTLKPLFSECRFVRAHGNKQQGAVAAILDHLIESRRPRSH